MWKIRRLQWLLLHLVGLSVVVITGASDVHTTTLTTTSVPSAESAASPPEESSSASEAGECSVPPPPPLNECGLYMAVSSIPHSGWGMYNGAFPLHSGQRIAYGEPVIQVVDHDVNRKLGLFARHQKLEQDAVAQQVLSGQRTGNGPVLAPPPNQPSTWWLLENYFWNPVVSYGYHEADSIQSVIPGLGMLANSHPGMVNARHRPPSSIAALDPVTGRITVPSSDSMVPLLHRSKDEGAGASTLYHDFHFVTETKPFSNKLNHSQNTTDELTRAVVPPYTELFVAYGDGWFAERTDELGPLPLSPHFKYADQVARQMYSILDQCEGAGDADLADINTLATSASNSSLAQKLLQLVQMLVSTEAPHVTNQVHVNRLLAALPKKEEDISLLANSGTAPYTLTPPFGTQPPDWFLTQGDTTDGQDKTSVAYCLDNIRPGRSMIPQAGYGAFAARMIPSGHLVAPLPVVHIIRADIEIWNSNGSFDKYQHSPKTQRYYREGSQLLLNYCFGSKNSSLLFYPYSPTVNYINHASSRLGLKPNVELRWASSTYTANLHHDDWFSRTPASLVKNETHAGLVLEAIALRDIEPGEEILLDYGNDWEMAWEDFVSTHFKPKDTNVTYVSAAKYNQNRTWIPTEKEMDDLEASGSSASMTSTSTYNRSHVRLWCWTEKLSNTPKSTINITIEDDESIPPEQVAMPVYSYRESPDLFRDVSDCYPCDILERHYDSEVFPTLTSLRTAYDNAVQETIPGDENMRNKTTTIPEVFYTVKLYDYEPDAKDDDDGDEEKDVAYVTDLPRHAIYFFDQIYQSDTHLQSAFRHEIGLPEQLIPPAWRDLSN